MKLFKKLAAAALAGVMALSMLTGCAIGDAQKEDAMLTALQTIGNSYGVEVSESKELSKKAGGVFSAFKTAGGTAVDMERSLAVYNSDSDSSKVTYKEIDYRVIVIKMPSNAKDSTKWGLPAEVILDALEECIVEQDESRKLEIGFDVMNNAKLTSEQEKSEDYMVVFAKAQAEDTDDDADRR